MMGALDTIKLDKDIPIPLYYQLKKQILALIKESRLEEGCILPPENELCEMLNVSRPTIRQAFGELVAEGYLKRFKGKGTFVASPKVEDLFLRKLESFNEEMRQKGMVPHTQILDIRKVSAIPEANEKLGLLMHEPLLFLSRLRFADNIPFVFVETYLPFQRFAQLLDIDFTSASLYESLETIYNVRVNRVVREIEAMNIHKREAALLQLELNSAICFVKTLAYAADDSFPVEYSIARYRGDRSKFSVEILR